MSNIEFKPSHRLCQSGELVRRVSPIPIRLFRRQLLRYQLETELHLSLWQLLSTRIQEVGVEDIKPNAVCLGLGLAGRPCHQLLHANAFSVVGVASVSGQSLFDDIVRVEVYRCFSDELILANYVLIIDLNYELIISIILLLWQRTALQRKLPAPVKRPCWPAPPMHVRLFEVACCGNLF